MKKTVIVILCLIAVGILGFGLWRYSVSYAYNKAHFPEKTVINGVDCSGMDVSAACDALSGNWDTHTFTVAGKDGNVLGRIKLSGTKYDIRDDVADIMHKTMFRKSSGKKAEYTVTMRVSDDAAIKRQVSALRFLDNDYTVKTSNAHVDLSDTDFDIVKEVYGNNVSRDRFRKAVLKDISHGKFALVYDESDYYELPTVKSDDDSLKTTQEFCKKYLVQKVKYKMHGTDVTLTPQQLSLVCKEGEGGRPEYSRDGAKKLAYQLAYKYDTVYATRQFKSASGETVTVSGMGYGYKIDQSKEADALYSIIKSGKDTTRTPVYSSEPMFKGKDELTKNFVEVDIGSQTLYLVQNHKKVLSTGVVTGKVTDGHATPQGVFKLQGKQRNATLRGRNADGSDYESKVSYWMPFNGGIGLHDAPWRGSFGGSIYYRGGSHGCVNMPPWAAARVYNVIEVGWPVVVHQ